MKKTVLAVGGMIVLGVLCYVAPLSGQGTPPGGNPPPAAAAAPAATRTRIAILNLTYVIKKYEKYKRFQDEIKTIVEPFQKKDTELRAQLDALRQQAEKDPSQRDALERQAKDLQHKMEDNSLEAKMKLGKRSDDEMKILFMDVYQAAQGYAASHDFEMVLHYNDAVTPEDFVSTQNIARKLNTGALMPLYWQRSMDISQDVVNLLNYNVSAPGGAGAAPQPNR